MAEFDSVGETNARQARNHITRRRKTAPNWPVARDLSRVLMNGPSYCIVRRNRQDYEKVSLFEPVLRIWTGPSSLAGESCAVYEDGHMPGAVLRYVSIGRKSMHQARATGILPELTMVTRYISQEYYEPLTKDYEPLDDLLKSAGLIQPVTDNKPWRLFSLYRATEISTIELKWNRSSVAPTLEALMQTIATNIKDTIHQHEQQNPRLIERLEFVYDNPLLHVLEILDYEYNTPSTNAAT